MGPNPTDITTHTSISIMLRHCLLINNSNLLLASQSPRRRVMLALLGLPFDVTTADIDETPLDRESPIALVARLSQAKARAIQSEATIITSDTVVALEGQLLGKPADATEATATLKRLRARPHHVYSGVTVRHSPSGRILTDVARTEIVMRNYTDTEIATYVASGDPFDKAGSYAVQSTQFHPAAQINGCYANVMGLPLCHLTRCLRTWHITVPADIPAACQEYTGHTCPVYAAILAGQPGCSPL